jgi:hypothetical protein
MAQAIKGQHDCPVTDAKGGVRTYWFRTPTVYDLPTVRRSLTRRGVRRPASHEFEVAAFAGIAAMAETVGEPEEGERQRQLMEEWYRLRAETDEDDIDEPDFELRAAEVLRLEGERIAAQREILPSVAAIEANLERHWPPYAELLADRRFWDEVSNIEIVRLLLVSIDAEPVRRDKDGLMRDADFQALPPDARPVLTAFALRLLVPTETQRKN